MQNKYFAADALAIDHDRKVVTCNDGSSEDNFEVAYDKLAIATGSQGSTFGIPGEPQRIAHIPTHGMLRCSCPVLAAAPLLLTCPDVSSMRW